jgi:ATP-dependent RNA helicase DDX1
MNNDDKDTMLIIHANSSSAAAAAAAAAAGGAGASAGGRAKNKRSKERGGASKEDEEGGQGNGAGIQTLEASGNQWMGCRATHGVTGGKYCFEVAVVSDGIARVGFSSLSATRELGKDANGFGYGGTAKKSHANKFEDYGQTYGAGDVIGCFVDFKDRCIEFTKNGE